MAHSSSPSDASPLLDHLTTLYPFACLLVGPDEAPDLLLHVYQKATERPRTERPEDLQGWLLGLLHATSAEFTDEPSAPGAEADSTDDPLQRDVAKTLLEDAVPVALASCSPQERFLLAADALGVDKENGDDTTVADARARLWDHLRAVLSDPEYALVDGSVSDAALRDVVQNWVVTRFAPVPSSLRSRIRATLQAAQTFDQQPADEEVSASSAENSASLLDRLPSRPSPQALLPLVFGLLLLAGGIGAVYMMQSPSAPASPSNTSLVAFSAERADAVTAATTITNRAEAESHLASTWNRQIRVPEIEGAQLQGVGQVQAGSTEIPVLLYLNAGDSTRIAAFAYSYALVDRIEATATLDTQVREELARRNHLVADTEASQTGLLWRDRDDIFVVVAPSIPADSLRTRLRP